MYFDKTSCDELIACEIAFRVLADALNNKQCSPIRGIMETFFLVEKTLLEIVISREPYLKKERSS